MERWLAEDQPPSPWARLLFPFQGSEPRRRQCGTIKLIEQDMVQVAAIDTTERFEKDHPECANVAV
jgi:hypothetical protein